MERFRRTLDLIFHYGQLTWENNEPPADEGWTRIHSPSSRLGYTLAVLAGLLIIFLLFGWLVAISLFTSRSAIGQTGSADSSTIVANTTLCVFCLIGRSRPTYFDPAAKRIVPPSAVKSRNRSPSSKKKIAALLRLARNCWSRLSSGQAASVEDPGTMLMLLSSAV